MSAFDLELAAKALIPKDALNQASSLRLAMHIGEGVVEAVVADVATGDFIWSEIFKPDFFDNWADSDNSVAQLGYGIADDGYLFLQSNPIGAAFDMDGVRSHLDGTNATQSEVESGFINGISNFVPASKGTKLFSKLNAAQFSSKFKSVLSHIKPSPQTRGKMNGALNKVVDKINNMNWNKTAVKQAKSKSEKLDDAVSE